jgi:hypothetical protein
MPRKEALLVAMLHALAVAGLLFVCALSGCTASEAAAITFASYSGFAIVILAFAVALMLLDGWKPPGGRR